MQTIATWMNPHGWQLWAVTLGLLATVGLSPLTWKADKATGADMTWAMTRRVLWSVAVGLPALLGVVVWWGAMNWAPGAAEMWSLAMIRRYSLGVAVAIAAGVVLRIAWFRYAAPAWSGWWRARWIGQHVDQPVDIRKEMDRIKPREFDPGALFKPDRLVLGQRDDGTPYSVSWDDFKSCHMQIVGATGRGKGVALQTIYAQLIRAGMGAWYFDPKGDAFIPAIMAAEARRAGRSFYVLDLVDRIGAYAPFAGGTVEERAERMVTAFQLERGGGESDYYKNAERLIVRDAVKRVASVDADLATLLDAIEIEKARHLGKSPRAMESKMTAEALLAEWSSLTTIAVRPEHGLNVAKALAENAIVYVRCGLRGLTADVASVLLIELMDELIRNPPSAQGRHVGLGIDEAATLMSQQVVSGVTAVRSTGTTMMIAYQALEQVRNMRDQRVDKDAAETTMNINCEFKIIYGTSMEQTAEQISLSAGRRRVQVAMNEATEIGPFGGEQWSGKRSFREDEDQLISTDTIKALPKRVAVVLLPNRLAELVYTCWLPGVPKNAYLDALAAWKTVVGTPAAPKKKQIAFGKGASVHREGKGNALKSADVPPSGNG